MLTLSGRTRVFLARNPVDFRKAHDGLCAIVRNEFEDDPFGGDIFVFFNKSRDRIKLLVWDRNGFWLHYKRLEKGTFPIDLRGAAKRMELSRAQLAMILEGIDGKSARILSHFSTPLAIKSREAKDGTHPRTSP